jgi:hypothetical protein
MTVPTATGPYALLIAHLDAQPIAPVRLRVADLVGRSGMQLPSAAYTRVWWMSQRRTDLFRVLARAGWAVVDYHRLGGMVTFARLVGEVAHARDHRRPPLIPRGHRPPPRPG